MSSEIIILQKNEEISKKISKKISFIGKYPFLEIRKTIVLSLKSVEVRKI
ncbi:MAG: hypothetical protein QM426_01630 [Euryarchaeota archaeon]|nr:hypothetical protein [Euryarchaeota archaeon]